MRKYLLILFLSPAIAFGQVYYGMTDSTFVAYGLATDTKPTPTANFCYFVEVNTNKTFVSSGGVWSLVGIGVDSIATRLAFVTDSLATAVAAFVAATYATITNLNLKAPIASPTFTGTVGGITASMVGLGNVDNTSNATERAASAVLTSKTMGMFNYAADAGSNDTYVISLSPAPAAYTTGMIVIFRANTVNTGAASLNVNSLGAITIVKRVSTTLANADIASQQFCMVVYNGTNFVLMNPTVN